MTLENLNLEIINFLKTNYENQLEFVDLTKDSNLHNIGLDSLDLVGVITSIESKYNVSITDTELESLNTIEGLSQIILSKL